MPALYDIFVWFFLYAFLGWCTEVVYAAAVTGRFVNRGFLCGPVCPIYGFGMVAVLTLLRPVQDNLLLLFLGSVVLTTVLEFLVGWLTETLLHERLWDYSNVPFNIKGYVCLKFSLAWGLGCLLLIKVIHPVLMKPISWIPHTVGWWILGVFSVIILTDLVLTGIEAMKISKRIRAAEELERMLREVSDGIGENLSGGVLAVRRHLPEWEEKWNTLRESRPEAAARLREKWASCAKLFEHEGFTRRRLLKAFPRLQESRLRARMLQLQTLFKRTEAEKKPEDAPADTADNAPAK